MGSILVRNGKILVNGGKFLIQEDSQETPPSPGPTGLATSSITDTSVSLSWNSLSGATNYVIEGRVSGGNYSVWGTTTITSLDVNSLSPGTTYDWRVKATVSGSDTLYSDGPQFSTTGTAPSGSVHLAKPFPYYEALEVDTSLAEITLDFKDGVKWGGTVSAELRTVGGTLVHTFGSGDRSIGGHWNQLATFTNFPTLTAGESYSLVITSGSIQDLISSNNWAGFALGDYTFNMVKSSYNEIYVSPTGNDSNDGLSTGNPKLTLSGAWAIAGADSRINLAAGTYRMVDVTLSAKTNNQNPVIIQGAGKNNTFLKGSQVLTGWTNTTGNIWKTSLDATGFESQACWDDGVHLTQIGVTSIYHVGGGGSEQYLTPQGTDENDLVQGSFYHKASSNEIFVWLSDDSDPNSSLMEAGRSTWVLETRDVSGLVIKDLTIEHTGNDNRGTNGCLKPGPRQRITNCNIRYSTFQNFRITSSCFYLEIDNCDISYAGDVGVDANGGTHSPSSPKRYFLFRDNEVHNNNYRGFDYAWHSGGFKLIPAMYQTVVDGNNCYENHGPNIWYDHPFAENLIQNNIVTGHTDSNKLGQGIFYEVSEAYNEDWGAVIRNNLVKDTHRQGIYVSASQDAEVYNNTITASWTPLVLHGMPRNSGAHVYKLLNNTAYDNIIENKTGATGSYTVIYTGNDTDGNPVFGNSVDGNFYNTAYSGSSPNAVLAITTNSNYGGTDTGVGSGSTACGKGFECTGLSGDAQFVDRINFQLQGGSPAAGKGYLG